MLSLVRTLMGALMATVMGVSLASGSTPPARPPAQFTATTMVPAPPPTATTTTTGAAAPTTPSTVPVPPPPPGQALDAAITPIDEATAARMTASWRPGCPVPLSDLRLVTITHLGFDGAPHQGELVVHHDAATAVADVFRALFDAGFPIEQVRLIDEFAGSDDASMAANNTSAFNCRRVAGTRRWSEHAYGRAVDLNPAQNPYMTRRGPQPPASAAFTDRAEIRQGMVTPAVVDAFADVGWGWGGRWSRPDYQHFSATNR